MEVMYIYYCSEYSYANQRGAEMCGSASGDPRILHYVNLAIFLFTQLLSVAVKIEAKEVGVIEH